ncbi:MAG: polysaccharide lyase 6 family protein [Marinifilaceae bacterium]
MREVRFVFLLLILLVCKGVVAEDLVRVASVEDIVSACEKGERNLVLKDGEYKDFQLELSWNGTKQQSLQLKAEHPGKVILTGNSKIVLSGNHILLSGLDFNHGKRLEGGALIFVSGENNRITQTRLRNYNQVTGVWIQLNGRYNRVDHCWFEGKTSGASYINVDVPRKGGNHHFVDSNYFSRPPLGRNGGSAMRIGHGSMAKRYCYTTVEYNLFDDCSGEGEIMSSKSCGNTFRYNTFLNCKGGLSLRQGVEGIVESNFFISNKGEKNHCSGVSIRGRKHLVLNNYFYGLAPKKGAVISFGAGSPSDPQRIAKGLIARHFPKTAENVIAHNLFVRNHSLCIDVINDLGHRNKVIPPDSLCFFDNVLVGAHPLVRKHTQPQYLLCDNNLYQGQLGIEQSKGFQKKRVKLVEKEPMLFTPKNEKVLSIAANARWTKFLTDEMKQRLDYNLNEGSSRSGVRFVPDGERGGLQHPFSKTEVGPEWMNLNQ